MLAIPVFRARVAPVLDWCSKILIIPEGATDAASCRQINVPGENIFGLMRMLREEGIKTLICGALSPEMLNYGESMGVRIVHGIAGDIEEVLQAYREQKLDQPKYWIPGCRRRRRYKSGARCGEAEAGIERGAESGSPGPGRAGRGSGSSRKDQPPGGPGGFCICPKCGSRVEHERGIPCMQVLCPQCSSSMIRG